MKPKRIVLTLALVLIIATVAFTPTASAERITGCTDGWNTGDADCFLADHVPQPDCALGVRECDPPS